MGNIAYRFHLADAFHMSNNMAQGFVEGEVDWLLVPRVLCKLQLLTRKNREQVATRESLP